MVNLLIEIIKSISGRDLRQFSLKESLITLSKVIKLLILPVPATLFALAVWYFIMKPYKVIDLGETEDMLIVLLAWISLFSILYSLLATAVVTKVFDEYKKMRAAARVINFWEFILLRDENIIGVVHGAMTVLASAVIAGFMAIHYPTTHSGLWVIGSTTYLFAFIYWVVKEIDDPCVGIWVIPDIEPEWLLIDSALCRRKKLEAARAEWQEFLPGFVAQVEQVEEPEHVEKKAA